MMHGSLRVSSMLRLRLPRRYDGKESQAIRESPISARQHADGHSVIVSVLEMATAHC